MFLLEADEISKQEQTRTILHRISFKLAQFKKIAIVGETGSGKSTLLKILSGQIQPNGGNVFFQGEKVLGPSEKLIPGHPAIAYLSQHFELRNNYFVNEILAYASKISEDEANIIFQICQVDHLMMRKTDQLSGGERQRIALARLLVGAPSLLLLDEPFSNLDMTHKKMIRKVIQQISEELGITCLLVSHDPVDVLSWSDQIMVLKDGKLVQQGTPREIYFKPINEYVAGLFGAFNLILPSSKNIIKTWGLSTKKDPIIIRPEYFSITNDHHNSINAIINKIIFCGQYIAIELETAEQPMLIYTKNDNLRQGDKIKITLSE